MHRSFTPWMNSSKEMNSAKKVSPAQEQTESFDFSKEMEVLEERQKMDFSDLEAYVKKAAEAPVLYVNQSRPVAAPQKTSLAQNSSAKQPSVYQSESILQVHQQIDHVVDDNRTLASQVQSLLVEKERLTEALAQSEDELNRFYRVFGNFYIRH